MRLPKKGHLQTSLGDGDGSHHARAGAVMAHGIADDKCALCQDGFAHRMHESGRPMVACVLGILITREAEQG